MSKEEIHQHLSEALAKLVHLQADYYGKKNHFRATS